MQGGRCLVLNATMEFLHVTPDVFKSAKLLIKGSATPLELYPFTLRSEYGEFEIPAIAVLKRYVPTPKKNMYFTAATKRNVLMRDKFRCAYCEAKLSMHTCTKDHVLPVSRGGSDTMNNVVAACFDCNQRKANRTPEEARMPLRAYPRPLTEEEKLELLVKTHKSSERNVWRASLQRLELNLF